MQGLLARREFLALAFLDWRKPSIAGISFRVLDKGTDRRRYIWIHGDEQTARAVLVEHMEKTEGRAFLIENKERNVSIHGGKLDPNRMFSRAGALKNLQKLNPSWSQQQIDSVLNRLDEDRPKFLRRLLPRDGDLLVAMHNNGPNYSAKDEVSNSNVVAMNDPDHADEFLLCSTEADFGILANSRFNALLQDKPKGDDDGSLSRLCAAAGVRYVNIEAAHGNAEGQRRMLEWVETALP
jgi:hypothetical protein